MLNNYTSPNLDVEKRMLVEGLKNHFASTTHLFFHSLILNVEWVFEFDLREFHVVEITFTKEDS